jgi:multidrug efflux pump subunit AcrB
MAQKEFLGIDVQVELLPMGPPAGRAVQYRVSGPNVEKVREHAQELAAKNRLHPLRDDVGYNWMEPTRVVKLEVLQDKARQLGVTSEAIAQTLNGIVGGTTVTQVRDDIYLVNVIARAREEDRDSIETLQNLQLMAGDGKAIPLAAVANLHYELEPPIVWRRNRLPTITVRANILGSTQPATIVQQLSERVDEFQRALPAGYRVEVGGPVEESVKSQKPIAAVVPLMLFVMATILMIQLQSFQRLFMVVAVAPLGLIGVVAALLPSQAPLGFIALLGVLALIGILIRNSVILIVQIEEHRSEGMGAWEAVLESTMHRTRPIMLTAAAASLALIPICRDGFWAPMAFAMMGGIIVGTLLTLLFLPALYIAWFRIKPPVKAIPEPGPATEPTPTAPDLQWA